MFTQRISMDCTKWQYENCLKDELLKMGYKEWSVNYWEDVDFCYMCNSYSGNIGNLGTIHKTDARSDKRTYLGSFNAPLFLALAAMTDKAEGNYGEYVIGLNSGMFHKMKMTDKILPEFIYIRKATKDEIIARFSNIETDTNYDATKEFVEDFCDKANNLKVVAICDNISFDATELESEMSRLIDELWGSIEKSHIDALKSKGYKILKPKTWEEV